MKKTERPKLKLVLKRETVRKIVDAELARVPGAGTPVTVDSCPPCLIGPGKDAPSLNCA